MWVCRDLGAALRTCHPTTSTTITTTTTWRAGRGAYGTVVKARDTTNNQHVAIKIIPLTDTDPAETLTIQKEIDFLSGCHHPNVVRYIVSWGRGPCLWASCSCLAVCAWPCVRQAGRMRR